MARQGPRREPPLRERLRVRLEEAPALLPAGRCLELSRVGLRHVEGVALSGGVAAVGPMQGRPSQVRASD
eukprot:4548468-Lingulodinium_polyedra.AAC.1